MIKSTRLLLPFCIGAVLSLGACATAPAAPKAEQAVTMPEKVEQVAVMPEKVAVVESTKQAVTETDSGKLICKRQTTVGSKFKRKVCATAAQWKATAERDRRTTAGIQRSKAPGGSN